MNAHIDRIRDLARPVLNRAAGLTATQRVTSLLVMTLVVAITIGWFRFRGQATEELLPNMTSKSARAAILKALADAKLTGFTVDGDRILIPRGESQKYLAALPDNIQLHNSLSYHRDQAARQSSVFELPGQAADRREGAVVRDLEKLFCQIPGVEDAFVHFDETVEAGLKPKRISTAAVAIVTDGKTRLSRRDIEHIRRTVLPFRSGLKLSDVMVIDVLGGWSVGGPGSDDSHVRSFEHAMRFQEGIEQRWQQKVSEVLAFIPSSRVVVTTQTPSVDPNRPPGIELHADRHLGISVSVPLSYHLRRLKNQRGGAQRTLKQVQGDTEEQIRNAIHGLIKSEYAQVAVTTFDDMPATDVAAPSRLIAELRGRRWAAGIAMLIAAGGGLTFYLASRGKSKLHVDEPVATISMADETVDTLDLDSTLEREDSELRATLTDRVQNDPDQAVRVLNQWLSRAG